MKFGFQAATGSLIKAIWVFVLFAEAARAMSPVQFADFSFWLTVAFVVGLLLDFGQQTALLTRFSKLADGKLETVRQMTGLKYALSLAVIAAVIAVSEATQSSISIWLPLTALIAALFGSMNILVCIPCRAAKNYVPDIWVGTAEGLGALAAAVIIKSGYDATALSYMLIFAAARMAGLVVGIYQSKTPVQTVLKPAWPATGDIREWLPFFVHVSAGTMIINLDLLVTKVVLGPVQYSIYQAGMRFVHASNIILTAINNVLIPQWSQSDREFGYGLANRAAIRMIGLSVVLAAFGALLAFFIGEWLAILVFGPQFAGLGNFLPAFAVLVGMRLSGSIIGVLLSCRGAQILRTVSSVVGLIVLGILLYPSTPAYDVQFVLLSQIIVHTIMMAILVWGFTRVRSKADA